MAVILGVQTPEKTMMYSVVNGPEFRTILMDAAHLVTDSVKARAPNLLAGPTNGPLTPEPLAPDGDAASEEALGILFGPAGT
jgi:hypothetical protein